jgi:CheY-like chemotaxis protein
VVRSTLERAGYRVLEAVDGPEALEVFRRHAGEVKLCLMDVVMPRLNGKDALAAIHAIAPETRALFVSGYATEVLSAQGLDGIDLVHKPVAPSELLRAVRTALDRPV